MAAPRHPPRNCSRDAAPLISPRQGILPRRLGGRAPGRVEGAQADVPPGDSEVGAGVFRPAAAVEVLDAPDPAGRREVRVAAADRGAAPLVGALGRPRLDLAGAADEGLAA